MDGVGFDMSSLATPPRDPQVARPRSFLTRRCWPLLGTLLVLLGAIAFGTTMVGTPPRTNVVFIVPVRGTIYPDAAATLIQVLGQAEREGAQAVIIEVDTPGGSFDAAFRMRDAILASPVRTIAFVNDEAFSAGAVVAIAADEIYMVPKAVVGLASPPAVYGVEADNPARAAIGEMFKATAEARGRDPRVAEAMVDSAVAIAGLVTSGELLMLTPADALGRNYANAVVTSRSELLVALGLQDVTVRKAIPGVADSIAPLLTNPVIASSLLILGLLVLLGAFVSRAGHARAGISLGALVFFS